MTVIVIMTEKEKSLIWCKENSFTIATDPRPVHPSVPTQTYLFPIPSLVAACMSSPAFSFSRMRSITRV